MKQQKIGIISTWFERGATRVSLAYIAALESHYKVCVYARGGDAFPHHDPFWDRPWVHWGEFVPGAPSTYIDRRDFMRWLRREQPDLLLFNEQQSWDIITFLHSEDLWKQGKKRPIMGAYIDYYTDETQPFFGLYDFLLCNTRRHYSVFEDHPQSLYIPWGLEVSDFPFAPRLHEPLTYFHSLGYNPQRKGTDLLIHAFRRMQEPNLKLVLHAQRPLSDFPELEVLVKADERIEWMNQEVPPPGLYHLGDVYVYPSRLDGIGLSLPEALASGLPAVVTDEAPMNEFVQHGQNGWLVPVERRMKREDGYYWPLAEVSISELQSTLEQVLSDKDNLESMKASTRQGAEKYLNWMENSRGLAQQLVGLRALKADAELLEACRSYERMRSRRVSAGQRIHRLLIALGARKVKRFLMGRS